MKFGIREFAFVAVMLGLVAGSYLMVVRPHAIQREGKLTEIRSMDTALADLNRKTADMDELGRRIDQQKQAVDGFGSRLASAAQLDAVLKGIGQMADANSLQRGVATTLKSEQVGGYIAQPIRISLNGDFNGFYSFLLQLETLPRITRVTQMKLEKIDGHDGEMRADMTLCIFLPAVEDANAGASADTN